LGIAAFADAEKTNAKRKTKGMERPRFFWSLILPILAFGATLRKPAFARSEAQDA